MPPLSKAAWAIVVGIVVVVAAVGATLALYWPFAPAAPKEEIVIGMSISLTGQYATPGTFQLQGVQLWRDDVNAAGGIFVEEYGKKMNVSLVYYDDASEKEKAVNLAEKLIDEDKVDVLFGPYGSPLTFSVAPIAEARKKLMISIMGSSDSIFEQGYEYVIQLLTPGSLYLRGMLDLVKAKDPAATRVAALYADDAFSTVAGQGAVAYAGQLGLTVVYDQAYPKDITDFSSILVSLKATNPDIIVGGGHYEDGVLLCRQLKEYQVDAKAIGILVAPPIPAFREELGPDAEYILGPSQWEPAVLYQPDFGPTPAEFFTSFNTTFGKEPEYRAASGYGAGLLVQKLIEEAGTLDGEQLRAKAGELDFTTLWGRFKIDPETGLQTGHEMVVMSWIEGERYIVWPADAAQRDPVYPKPPWGGT